MISSPGSSSVIIATNSACLADGVTTIPSSGSAWMPLSPSSLCAIAARRSGMPRPTVYLVCPSRSAAADRVPGGPVPQRGDRRVGDHGRGRLVGFALREVHNGLAGGTQLGDHVV